MSDLRNNINIKLKYIESLIIIGLVLVFISGLPAITKAQGASLYLSPKSGTFFVGSTFDVSIFINTEGYSINAVQVDLKFPSNVLQVTSPTAGDSFISIWANQPFYSNEEGIVSLKGGVLSPGIKTSAGLVSTVTFRVKASGVADISFLDSSKILLADGKGTDILKTSTGGKYNLVTSPPEGPKVFSSTHPSLTTWYRNNNPEFYWEKTSKVTGFSYSFNRDPKDIPDNISEGESNSVSFSEVKDGINYFHIKAGKSGIWGGVSHYPIHIDTTPPPEFKIQIERFGGLTRPEFFVNFSTKDSLSGIDYYEISTVDINDPQSSISPFFIETISPYKIPSKSSGKYLIIVNAYDKAGNYIQSKEILHLITPFLVYVEEGIMVKGLFLRWWLVYGFLIILIGSIGFFIYRILRKGNLEQRLEKEVAEAEKEIEDVKRLKRRIRGIRSLEEKAEEGEEKLIEKLKGREEDTKYRKY